MILQNLQQFQADDFRDRALHSKLDDTGQVGSPQSEEPSEVQILSDDDGIPIRGIIEDKFVWVADPSHITPVSSDNSEWSEVIAPAWREIFVNNQSHDAMSS